MWERNRSRVQDLAANAGLAASSDGSPSDAVAAESAKLVETLETALADDLAIGHFWPRLFAYCRFANGCLASGGTGADARRIGQALADVDGVLGLLDPSRMPVPPAQWPEVVARLARDRGTAREARDFARADALRGELEALGYRVEDAADGVRLFPQG